MVGGSEHMEGQNHALEPEQGHGRGADALSLSGRTGPQASLPGTTAAPWPLGSGSGAGRPPTPLLIGPARLSTGTDVSSLCQNGGLCVDSGPSHLCRCPPGFQGSLCQDRVSPCQSQPCQHGATCVAQPTGYLCQVSGVRAVGAVVMVGQ